MQVAYGGGRKPWTLLRIAGFDDRPQVRSDFTTRHYHRVPLGDANKVTKPRSSR